jgi:hypothetical protein
MAGTRAKALAKMQAAYGYWRPLLSCSSLPTRSDCSWFRPSSIPRSCMASVGHDEGGQRQDVSGRKKALRSILALHPRDCSSDVLYGDTGLLPPGVLDAAKLCWQHRCQNMEADGPGGAAILIRG